METKKTGNLEIRIFSDTEELSLHAAKIFLSESEKAIKARGIFTVSLSGGVTSQKLYELLGSDFKDSADWPNIHIFWGDERAPKDNEESSFQIACQKWLKNIIKENRLFENNIHRIKMELGPAGGAADYERELEKWAPDGFDLALNGAGADGHRNGVMPERADFDWQNGIWDLQRTAKVYGYKVPPEINLYTERITLTPWFLNQSRTNVLMLSGAEKNDLLRKIIFGQEKYTKRALPAITFNDAPTIILADEAAAAEN